MDKLVIASMRKSAGKTSVIVGLAKAFQKKCGYIKPFGDRLLYKKKRLWDYDSALVTNILGLTQPPEESSLGFEHSKLRYMYGADATKEKLGQIVDHAGQGNDWLFIETGADLSYGVSVHLDALTVARAVGAKLIVVASGDPDKVIDDVIFLKRSVDLNGIDFRGVILNKIRDPQDFTIAYLSRIKEIGVTVLGLVPQIAELSRFSVGHLADRLFGKVLTGEGAMGRLVEHVFIGAMSVNTALQHPNFKKSGKLVITSSDRSDMILAAIESNAAAVLVTDNQLPPSSLIATASEKSFPLIVVPGDVYQTAKQIDDLEPLLTKHDTVKIELLEKTIKECIQFNQL
jgi:BioD-like phosphotransacetylase family protein